MKAIFLFLFFTNFLFADDTIYVSLDHEIPLLPIHVSQIETKSWHFPDSYKNELQRVLVFDLNHNGMTKVLSEEEVKKKPSLTFTDKPSFLKLKQDQVAYVVQLQANEKMLSANIISVNSQSARPISGITLSGKLSEDRVKIHHLADTIFELLFGKKGIASSKILYTVKRKITEKNNQISFVSEAYEADYDGYNQRVLTNDKSYIAHPQYIPAPNGQKSSWFSFVSYKIGQPKLYAMPLKGGTPIRLSTLRGIQVTPGLSKDGKAFAFSSDITGKADLFYQMFSATDDEKPQQIFAAKGAANASPTFSPDGKQIVFVSNKDGTPKLYLMRIPKPHTRLSDVRAELLTKKNRENTAPSWSPDGKKIAYCARNSGDRQIWIYDFETNQEKQITEGKGTKENPTWARDSLHILFNASDGNETNLYLINTNQPDAVKITHGPGDKMFPCWEPN